MEGARTRAPKQWCLTRHETINSFESWRQNLLYSLSLDPIFADFLIDGAKWEKKQKSSPVRGLKDDGSDVPSAKRRTAQQKVQHLELMLGQIANFCPIISRSTIVKNSTSIGSIWQAIRLHFGFQSTGAHFLDFCDIKLENDERPEDLYQRLMAFVEDTLLKENGGVTHHEEEIEEDEDMSPTLENMVVLTWLKLIHPSLPLLVKQRYGTELRTRTLASIKPEISQALNSLLEELRNTEEVKVMRSIATEGKSRFYPHSTQVSQHFSKPKPQLKRREKLCPLCQQAGRQEYNHFLSRCKYLPDNDRQFMGRVRQVAGFDDPFDELDVSECDKSEDKPEISLSRRVQIKRSPFMDAFYRHSPVRIIIDTGAETNLVRASWVQQLGIPVKKSSQIAFQADGKTPMDVVGEVNVTFCRDNIQLHLEALVVTTLDVDVLAGVPFTDLNDIAVRTSKRQVMVGNDHVLYYGHSNNTKPSTHLTVRRMQSHVLRAPSKSTTVYPGEFVELDVPDDIQNNTLALEPRTDTPAARFVKASDIWPKPSVITSIGGKVRIVNTSDEPKVLRKNEHFCQVHTFLDNDDPSLTLSKEESDSVDQKPVLNKTTMHSAAIQLDPDGVLTPNIKHQFQSLLKEYDHVFDPAIKGYNGACGSFEATVNMGPTQPPQRKGRVPQYARKMLVELQQKFNELEGLGVFRCPEDIGISVEYLNPSFLVKKQNGGYRLVTAFSDVGRYSKPQPSLMPDVDSTIRTIASWKYIIVSDLSNAFYQIPLAQSSMKYCGVVTPFQGVRVYVRSAMGMPGSETALEELMCRILGNMLQEGFVSRVADDLYCGGNSQEELMNNWKRVLQALSKCDIRLSAKKTIICPKSTTILGWIWTQGSLHASPHRISTLSTCDIPEKVSGLRSYIGAYKFLARVLPDCSHLLAPLDEAVAGRSSSEKITWTDALRTAFLNAKKALASNKSIVLPIPSDQLWIVTDGSVKQRGLGATMYASRNGTPHLAGFFSAKLRKHQVTWLPCEIEALSIAAAVKHFSPYVIQSDHKPIVLTDSKPCVQAFEKLCRGEFSSSPRVSSFLSIVSHYQANIRHLAGSVNVPSDFASRNAPECQEQKCQICSFLIDTEDSVVRHVSVQDIINGTTKLPFISRSAWLKIQQECSDLRRVHAHLVQGTRPSKKLTHIKDTKRYLSVASMSNDKLLVVKTQSPLSSTYERIIVPRQVLDGLLTALHIKLDHPSRHQLKLVVIRYFYALDMDKAVERVSNSCHTCASLIQTPHSLIKQTTEDAPEKVGISFAADVIKRNRQLVLLLRETVTSYTATCFLQDERRDSLRSGLLCLVLALCSVDGPPVVIRVDPAPGFSALQHDAVLQSHHVSIDIGHVKNCNKNPVAEHAIGELEDELLRQNPEGGPVTSLTLAVATARLNSCIRSRGLSAREMWIQRDQYTNAQLPVDDQKLIDSQHSNRLKNHPYSEKSKAHGKPPHSVPDIVVGDIVYLYVDKSKLHARDKYLVVAIEGDMCSVRKFSGSQLRSSSYTVKLSECYKVCQQSVSTVASRSYADDESSDSDIETYDIPYEGPLQLPKVPDELSNPLSSEEVCDSKVSSPPPNIVCGDDTPTQPDEAATNSLRDRPVRQRRRPKYLEDYVCS